MKKITTIDLSHGGKDGWTICGWRSRARKNPVLVEREGSRYVFPEDVVLRAIGRAS